MVQTVQLRFRMSDLSIRGRSTFGWKSSRIARSAASSVASSNSADPSGGFISKDAVREGTAMSQGSCSRSFELFQHVFWTCMKQPEQSEHVTAVLKSILSQTAVAATAKGRYDFLVVGRLIKRARSSRSASVRFRQVRILAVHVSRS